MDEKVPTYYSRLFISRKRTLKPTLIVLAAHFIFFVIQKYYLNLFSQRLLLAAYCACYAPIHIFLREIYEVTVKELRLTTFPNELIFVWKCVRTSCVPDPGSNAQCVMFRKATCFIYLAMGTPRALLPGIFQPWQSKKYIQRVAYFSIYQTGGCGKWCGKLKLFPDLEFACIAV